MKTNNWEIRLAEYVEQARYVPFEWGKHDCITFANNALKCQTGHGFADGHLTGYKTALGASKKYIGWLRKSKYHSLTDALDDILSRVRLKFPPRGAVVAMPIEGILPLSFGVVVSQYCVFVGEEGLIFMRPQDDFMFWEAK